MTTRDPFFAAMGRVIDAAAGSLTTHGIPAAPKMRAYVVLVIDRKTKAVREQFEAMAPDSITCVNQHASHALEGEKLEVMSLQAWREQQRETELIEADRAIQQRKADDTVRREREENMMWEQQARLPNGGYLHG